jgi:hypothetical protein
MADCCFSSSARGGQDERHPYIAPERRKVARVRVANATEEAQARRDRPNHDVTRHALTLTETLLIFTPRT